jgi:acetyl-CoA carboxylase biotin carboxylase subunit
MFSSVLIANRGEIAVRVIRACRELGIKTVAVYSEADSKGLHVRLADEAVCIGKALPAESYLNIPALISAAEITDVEAIHPGYGFLSENAHFAEICESCKIKFIGPTPENMRLMGDKMAAKDTMKKAGVPITPGSETVLETKENALAAAKKIGYPVIIKASAGGGGKGMRICHNDVSLINGMLTAQSEAESAFGNSNVYMEKYIEDPRHIEFQIMADEKGNLIHLWERDCTIQRRHQKLIEEAPSVFLNDKTRKEMGEVAVKAARAVNYVGAGTIEFLVDRDDYYFMEMNTRIQVEHPVTEMITGIDLIKEQIRVAAGEELSYKQKDIKITGAAVECRINAEDPDNNFQPCPGTIQALSLPGGPGVRVDTHVYSGYSIPPFYDSMISKVITYGINRDDAINKMQRALEEFIISPIKTTVDFHKKVLNNLSFRKGNFSTHFVERYFAQKEDK